MRIQAIAPFLMAMAFGLAACGGGGGGVASLPPPPPPPPPPTTAAVTLVPAETTTQQFTVTGASHLTAGDGPHLDAADQLQVRYDASSNTYEVQLPGSQTWSTVTGSTTGEIKGGSVTLVNQFPDFQYSSLIEWFTDGSLQGVESIGSATPASAVPVVGSATYDGYVYGTTSETGNGLVTTLVGGTINFNFDFAQGTLSGSALLDLDPEWHDYTLGPFAFRDTVYSTGSTSFSGSFDTDVAGLNSFSGLFTGPSAQELIGNWAIPYRSPVDNQVYQAAGAFIGKKN